MPLRRFASIAILLVAGATRPASAQQSAELKQYLAIRDSFQRRIPVWPSPAKINWDSLYRVERGVKNRLEPLARVIIGPFKAPGFVQPGVYNVDTFLPGSEDSFLADGIRYQSANGKTRALVSTLDLIRVWSEQEPIRALSSLGLLNRVFPTDAGVTPYAVIPVASRDARVLVAILMARQQDIGPTDPDDILISMAVGNRLVVVESDAPVVIAAPGCKGPHWLKPLGSLSPPATAAESLFNYPFQEDAGYRACYSRAVVKDPRWPQIVARAQQIVNSIASEGRTKPTPNSSHHTVPNFRR